MRQIVDLKAILSGDPIKAVELFEKIVNQGDEAHIQESCQTMANYIRHSSIFKRKIIFEKLRKCSILCRLYLSFQFHSFNDSIFPRKFIFEGCSVQRKELEKKSHRRHHVTAVGSNRFFNLGVISDGSPVEEPRLVNVPRVISMEMSNTHTVFLSADNQLFGCGKAASFLPEKIDETDGGYVATPSPVQIPGISTDKSIIQVIRVSEGGTQISIDNRWYYIGKCPKKTGIRRISSNCCVSTDESTENSTKIPENQEANVPFEKTSVKIHVALIDGALHWDRSPSFNAKKEISVIINGSPLSAEFDTVRVINDGRIYLSKNGIFKGKLEFWKNQDDGFTVKSGTVLEHFDTKYTLVALLEEVPGTVGTEFFAVSPDGNNLIMKIGYQYEKDTGKDENFKFRSLHTHLIFKEREKQHDPVEIPQDLTLCFQNDDGTTTEYPTNRLIFEMMFPELKNRIQNGEFHFPHKNLLTANERNLKEYMFEIDVESLRHLPNPLEFVPNGTDPSEIWYLTTTDKQRIPCHKYLLLLHSRQISAMQRFQSAQAPPLYGSYQFEPIPDEIPSENVEIEANCSSETVKNALRAMLNPAALFEIKTIELIECVNFYDYHLMDELFDDAMHILLETITDFTLPYLYELFYSYEDKIIDGILQRPYLLFNSISGAIPPREMIEQFSRRFPIQTKITETHGYSGNFEAEYIFKYYLDLDQDSEESVWKLITSEFGAEMEPFMVEAMKRKNERKTVRSRNNSHTFRPDSSSFSPNSSPIPIAGRVKNDSFSNSTPPFGQSPLISPGKAIPMPKTRTQSISNSLEDFPEISLSPSSPASSSLKAKSPFGGRFVPKGTRFVNANQILKPAAAVNPWKKSVITEEEIITSEHLNFDEIVQKEEKLQRNIRTGFRKVQLLPHVETEELAGSQILEVFRREFHDEALICVELVMSDDLEVENEQIVWGNMPGLVRR